MNWNPIFRKRYLERVWLGGGAMFGMLTFFAGQQVVAEEIKTSTTTATQNAPGQTTTQSTVSQTSTTTQNAAAQNAGGQTTTSVTVTEPIPQLSVPATSRNDALMRARLNAGRANPFTTPSGFAKLSKFHTNDFKPAASLPKVHIPPPPTMDSHLAVPPPPTEVPSMQSVRDAAEQAGSGVDMPEPPEKPLISEKMKLVGVVGDKAFFAFTDLELKRANKFPSTVVLANGEQFESVHLVSIASNSVVLEEDGERFTKELERIR